MTHWAFFIAEMSHMYRNLHIRPRLYEANPQSLRVPLSPNLNPVGVDLKQSIVSDINVQNQTVRYGTNDGDADYCNYDRLIKDEQFYTEFNDDITGEDSYTLVDVNIQYTAPDERLTVNVWGKNITDELVTGGAFVNTIGRAITNTYLPPATGGVTIG